MNLISKIFSQKEEKNFNIDIFKKSLEYPDYSICDFLYESVLEYPDYIALDYYGKNMTYKKLYSRVEEAAKALKAIGVEKNDRITICMPNTPEAIIMFYAVNMVGAVSSMIHPLASENEIEYYIESAKSKYILTIDLIAEKVIKAVENQQVNKIIIADISNGMFAFMKSALSFYDAFKSIMYSSDIYKIKYSDEIIRWNDFVNLGLFFDGEYKESTKGGDEAVILYSGGTTGKPKGVRLSNLNLNALSMQCISEFNETKPGDSILLILPIFHGFGLGVSMHTILTHGMKCVLVPKFKSNEFVKLIKRYKPVFLTGVPTMYESLVQNRENSNFLRSVKYCICGGDILSKELKNKVDNYLVEHGSNAQIRVGYGLTESTAACILTPNNYYKEGALGVPLPDTEVKIFKPNTIREIKNSRVGEICISGPTVMLGYLDEPEENAAALKQHDDSKIWLHTGDLGYIAKNGVIFYNSRIKRMLITSGYNVYPNYIEKIIESHAAVAKCVVVGIPHPYKKQVPVACITLKGNYIGNEDMTRSIKNYCEKSIAKYAMPYKYVYIKNMPKTIIGKINYKRLEEECTKKYGR